LYIGRDFDPAQPTEVERYSFDFINDLQAGDSISTAVWSCTVAAKSETADPNAASCISGPAVYAGTKTTQRVSGLQAGCTYVLSAVVTTLGGDTVELWSHIECRQPGTGPALQGNAAEMTSRATPSRAVPVVLIQSKEGLVK